MDSLEAHLLVAAPSLLEPNFRAAVVLLIQHGGEGAFGVVLNRPSNKRVRDVWSQISDAPCNNDGTFFLGGPVTGPLVALHEDEELADVCVLDGVYCSTERDKLEQLVASDDSRYLLFAGYAGWSAGQLEREIETGSWLIRPAHHTDVFGGNDELWKTASQQIGEVVVFGESPPHHRPPRPDAN